MFTERAKLDFKVRIWPHCPQISYFLTVILSPLTQDAIKKGKRSNTLECPGRLSFLNWTF